MTLRHAPFEESWDFSIGLKPIAPDAWLEGGENDPAGRKAPLLRDHPQVVWGEAEGSRPAQAEAAALVEAALGLQGLAAEPPPLLAAALRVSDDLVLLERRDGVWRVTAVSLSAPTFFAATDVLGRSLAEIHGPVTGFSERFLARVERIFDSLRPDLILQRRNWSVVNSPEPFTPDPAPMRAKIPQIAPEAAAEALFLRVERQTLRRLPQTGAALFTIRVWLDPLSALAADPPRLAAFARAWRAAAADFRAYKRLPLYDELVASFLRAHGESHSVNAG
ncbi:MAG: heme-dependent oxidative N-demethylase subunit alpha family protein [Phenylobacterium sp.]|uniref:heme-dependent oxidative N-demethylase subunit alpha family protein n=1 Tax=Phenylobacterium sp. TaxID=1871053 RepID=UPI003918EAA1